MVHTLYGILNKLTKLRYYSKLNLNQGFLNNQKKKKKIEPNC